MRAANAVILARREYLSRLRSKAFWISTIALPVLVLGWAIVPGLVLARTQTGQRLALVDRTGTLAVPLAAKLAELAERTDDKVRFDLVIRPPETDTAAQRAALDRQVLDDEIAAWLWIDRELLEADRVEYHAESVSNFLTRETLERALSEVVREVRLGEAGYDSAEVATLIRSVDLETVRVSEEGSRADQGVGGFAVAFGLFMLLYMTTLIYGQQVMHGVLEEKSSRVVEVLLSSVEPVELMAGKLLGICLVGLTQLAIWLGVAAAVTAPVVVGAAAWVPEGLEIPTLSAGLLGHFFLLFLLGYFFYATFYAMIGAAFNNPQEAQQVAGIAVVFVVLPWVFFMPVLEDPDSTLAVVTSLTPVFTPFLMMLRIAIKTPPAWQLALGYLLTLALCAGMVWVCARIYRVGLLMYGKKPTFAELWRWVRQP